MKQGFDFFGRLFYRTFIMRFGKLAVLTFPVIFATLSSHGQTLGQAVNAPGLTWTTSGSGGGSIWTVQNSVTHDGASAARSSFVTSFSQTSTIQTTVTGPGKLTFWWYAANTDFSTLSFTVNGVAQVSFSSWGTWKKETFYLNSGSQTCRWINSGSSGSGYGYLDEVTYEPGTFAPEIAVQPLSQSQVAGLDTMFTVVAQGTAPLNYQWQFNETNIVAATNSFVIVSNIQPANLGNYRVIVTNSTGAITSSVASLEFGEIAAWGQTESVGWATVTNGATNIIAIAAGAIHGLAVNAGGDVLGWGRNDVGEVNVPSSATNLIAVAAGSGNSGGLKPDGTVVVWGSTGSATNNPASSTNFVACSVGGGFGAALKSDGTVTSWGFSSQQTNVPPAATNVVAISAGMSHTMAVRSDGTVIGWGSAGAGVLSIPANLTNVVAIAAGWTHNVALRDDGTVFAWGFNGSGQTNVPAGLTNVVAVGAGSRHSIALKANGTVIAWGNNSSGQTNVPARLTNVVAIAACASQNLALVGGPPILGAVMSNSLFSTNGFSVSVPTQSGRVYRLEYKSSFTDANWTPLPLVAGNGTNLVLTDPTAVDSQRFYRVRRW